MGRKATFVLVHGGWHGGWCFRRVADILTVQGYTVFAPTLTGFGERSHLFSRNVDLTTHVTDILNLIRWEELDHVVLAGHSYGGMVITGVADKIPDKIASLVYLDAFVPMDGQSLLDLASPAGQKAMRESATESNDFAVLPYPAARFNVNENDRAWVDRLCTPQPLASLTESLRLTGGIEKISRKMYVLTTQYPMSGFARFRDAVLGKTGWATAEVPCGHDLMIDMPERTAGLLIQAADIAHPGLSALSAT
jgi:pimeloyl-ACP methyl ester carboxylesterase